MKSIKIIQLSNKRGDDMAKYELFINHESNVFEIHDECCQSEEHLKHSSIELIDTIETDMDIHEAFKRYLMAYPQRKVIISECCRRHK